MKKHTPGPWAQAFIESGWGMSPYIKIQNRCLIFVIDDVNSGNILPTKEDARLMAAAPDLLAAASEAAMYLKTSDFGPVCREILERLNKAIAKATSEQ